MTADFRLLRDGGWGVALGGALAAPPREMEAWMGCHTRLLKADSRSRAGLLQLLDQPCFLKFYCSTSPFRAFALRRGIGRGVRAFDRALVLAAAGIRVPEPRACAQVSGGMLLLTEGFPQSVDLRALWMARDGGVEWGAVLGTAGRALANAHQAGFAHGDSKWSNLLWKSREVIFVDLESVRRARAGDPRCLRDIARFTLDAEELALPPALYRVFLDSYARASRCDPDRLSRAMRPALDKLRRRHLARYGPRGHRLL